MGRVAGPRRVRPSGRWVRAAVGREKEGASGGRRERASGGRGRPPPVAAAVVALRVSSVGLGRRRLPFGPSGERRRAFVPQSGDPSGSRPGSSALPERARAGGARAPPPPSASSPSEPAGPRWVGGAVAALPAGPRARLSAGGCRVGARAVALPRARSAVRGGERRAGRRPPFPPGVGGGIKGRVCGGGVRLPRRLSRVCRLVVRGARWRTNGERALSRVVRAAARFP